MSQSQELINLIRQMIRQEISNGAKMTYRDGVLVDASSYNISAYLDGDEESIVENIEWMGPVNHSAGQYITVATNESGTSWITRLRTQALFPRLVIGIDSGRIMFGDGDNPPSSAGSYGQQLYSGGPSGSAYWK